MTDDTITSTPQGEGELQRYPIDFSVLHAGMHLPADECNRILSTTDDDPARPFKLMAFKSLVEHETGIVTRIAHYGLRLLTPSEAAEFLPTETTRASRLHVRTLARWSLVDMLALTDEERSSAEAAVRYTSALTAALLDASKKAKNLERLLETNGESDDPPKEIE